MPSLKEVRNKITSVGSTMQITSAMKMVSAAKLKRAQDAIIQMRPYANKLKDILENVSASIDSSDNIYARNKGDNNLLIIEDVQFRTPLELPVKRNEYIEYQKFANCKSRILLLEVKIITDENGIF